MKPMIAITSGFKEMADGGPVRGRSILNIAYVDAVAAAGGIPVVLAPPPAGGDAHYDQLVRRVDGILFSGGPDLNPSAYGEALHPKTELMHARRQDHELSLFRAADAAGVPIMTICLGFQLAHVARGGALLQHLPDVPRDAPLEHDRPAGESAFHSVRINAESSLRTITACETMEVNSRHHQAVDPKRPGRGLRPSAVSPDGVVEASEDMDGRFLLAVQWHPEDMIDRREHLRLFEALVDAARRGVR